MFKALIPIIAVIGAVGLFFTYVQPTFSDIRVAQVEVEQYSEAVGQAEQLRTRIDELKMRMDSLTSEDLERLEALVPDVVDEVSLFVDIDALAQAHGIVLQNIKVGKFELSVDEEHEEALAFLAGSDPHALSSQDNSYESLDIGFQISGTYESFRAFLSDLERSLSLMDVMKVHFTVLEGDITEFELVIRVYSLSENN